MMGEHRMPSGEEMDKLQERIIDSLKYFAYLEWVIFYEYHIHDIWHCLDNLTRELHSATEKAEKLMKELGYEHD